MGCGCKPIDNSELIKDSESKNLSQKIQSLMSRNDTFSIFGLFIYIILIIPILFFSIIIISLIVFKKFVLGKNINFKDFIIPKWNKNIKK